MAVDYASRLSDYKHKGVCGVPEVFDGPAKLQEKVTALKEMMCAAEHTVVHTGAGISTSAGIPDFRGPKGVWTLEGKGQKVESSTQFGDTQPTLTHYALVVLVQTGYVKHVISQNVDGLHLKSGLARSSLSELHGNVFMERCDKCAKEYLRDSIVHTIGLRYTGGRCDGGGARGRCRGKLRDTVLDWNDALPAEDAKAAEYHSSKADLSLCLGSTLQIVPAGDLPLRTKKNNGKIVICNLQPTKHDSKADLIIHGYVDDVMRDLLDQLQLALPGSHDNTSPSVKDRTHENISPSVKERTRENISPSVKERTHDNRSHKTKTPQIKL